GKARLRELFAAMYRGLWASSSEEHGSQNQAEARPRGSLDRYHDSQKGFVPSLRDKTTGLCRPVVSPARRSERIAVYPPILARRAAGWFVPGAVSRPTAAAGRAAPATPRTSSAIHTPATPARNCPSEAKSLRDCHVPGRCSAEYQWPAHSWR